MVGTCQLKTFPQAISGHTDSSGSDTSLRETSLPQPREWQRLSVADCDLQVVGVGDNLFSDERGQCSLCDRPGFCPANTLSILGLPSAGVCSLLTCLCLVSMLGFHGDLFRICTFKHTQNFRRRPVAVQVLSRRASASGVLVDTNGSPGRASSVGSHTALHLGHGGTELLTSLGMDRRKWKGVGKR